MNDRPDNAHLPIADQFKWLFHSFSSGLAASRGLLCIFVPEDQACSVQPWAAEHNDFRWPAIQVVQQERAKAECRRILTGQRRITAEENPGMVREGNYLAAHLEEVIEETYKDLVAESNPNHRVASGWITIPAEISLTEEQAARVFDAVGVWCQQRAA